LILDRLWDEGFAIIDHGADRERSLVGMLALALAVISSRAQASLGNRRGPASPTYRRVCAACPTQVC
jgi:hypothetical protein